MERREGTVYSRILLEKLRANWKERIILYRANGKAFSGYEYSKTEKLCNYIGAVLEIQEAL